MMSGKTNRRRPLAGASPGRRERRRAETREKIFRAAMRLFADRGFFATTTADITEAADVGEGTFFNYFPTKFHVLTVLSEIQLRKGAAALLEAELGRAPVRDILRRLLRAVAEEPARSQALTRSLLAAFLSNEEVRGLTRETMARGRQAVAAILALGQERKEVRRDRTPAHLALAFQKGVLGTLLLWALEPKRDLDSWLEETWKDFWAAAAPGKGGAP
jgi:AcrR family transcriptional regulator